MFIMGPIISYSFSSVGNLWTSNQGLSMKHSPPRSGLLQGLPLFLLI